MKDKQIEAQNISIVALGTELKRVKMLLQEWRSKEVVPDLFPDLVKRTDKALQMGAR